MLTPPDVLWVGFTNPQYRPDGHPSTQLRPHRGADQWPQRSESMRRWSVALSCQTSALAAPGASGDLACVALAGGLSAGADEGADR